MDGLMDGWMDGWIDGLIDWLIDWLLDSSIDWLMDGLMDGWMDWWTDWLIDWLSEWVIDWLSEWLTDELTTWLIFRHQNFKKLSAANVFFLHFDLIMRFSPQRRAIFRHQNFKVPREWQFLTLSRPNVRFATAACNFRHQNFKKCSQTLSFLTLTSECASRHSGVQFCNIRTWKKWPRNDRFLTFSLPKMLVSPFFFCSCAALIMTMVTVLDEWRPWASKLYSKRRGKTQWRNKATKTAPTNKTQKTPKTPLVFPLGWNSETSSQWCRPGLSVLLFRQVVPLYSWMTLIAFLQVLELGAFDDGPSFFRLLVALPSFESIVFSGFLVCDGHLQCHLYWWSPRCVELLRPHRRTR